MRKEFEIQLVLGSTPIEEVVIPTKTRNHIAALMAALQYIYVTPEWNRKVFALLSERIQKGKKDTGRIGMSLWEIFVLAQVRLVDNMSYDDLHYHANYDTLLRGVLGVLPTDYSLGKQYEYQTVYDNVGLLDEGLVKSLNEVILSVGHQVFKKKEDTALRLKTDSFVVENAVHFPTDYNLLWDSARKCLDTLGHLSEQFRLTGWRKTKSWKYSLKCLMRAVGKATSGGGKNKAARVKKAVTGYLKKSRALCEKVRGAFALMATCGDPKALALLSSLRYYHQMLDKHIDLVERRLLKKETIPHGEKVFSIFQDYTEMIKKGKLHPNVEVGKKVAVTTDQYHLMVHHQIAEHQTDKEMTRSIVEELLSNHAVQSYSVDRGFSKQEDRLWLEGLIPEVIMPKIGKRTLKEREKESAPAYKKLKNKHSAIESNINELEPSWLGPLPGQGLDKVQELCGPVSDRLQPSQDRQEATQRSNGERKT